MKRQDEKLAEYDLKFKALEKDLGNKIEEQVEKSLHAYKEREERKCNVILHNIPEPKSVDNKKQEDCENIKDLFSSIQCEDVTPVSFFRLGKPLKDKTRLVKVCLDSVSNKHRLLGGTKILREKRDDEYVSKWSRIYITPDLTKEEIEKSKALRVELDRRKKDEKNDNLVIFRGEIVDKMRSQNTGARTTASRTNGGPRVFRRT